ncbi:hypothetical protein Lal_00014127 [Lupinus albus]|nr:hypothetical protein Lal_00014127 [Lupinus albus]
MAAVICEGILWTKVLESKYGVHTVAEIPCKWNLAKRGGNFSDDGLLCVWCEDQSEMGDHLFFSFHFSYRVWQLLYGWLRLVVVMPSRDLRFNNVMTNLLTAGKYPLTISNSWCTSKMLIDDKIPHFVGYIHVTKLRCPVLIKTIVDQFGMLERRKETEFLIIKERIKGRQRGENEINQKVH